MADLMYYHSQGVIDIALKLFGVAQVRAINDGSEEITGQLIDSVAKKELAMVMPMIEAIRNDDVSRLLSYKDLAPLGLSGLMSDVNSQYAGRKVRGAAILSNDPMFIPAIAQTLTTLGFDAEDADLLSKKVSNSVNVIDGVKKALKHSTSGPKRLANKSGQIQTPTKYEAGDYRNAINTSTPEETIFERMQALNMIADIEAILTA